MPFPHFISIHPGYIFFLPSFGVLILLFWFQNHLSILGVGKELWAVLTALILDVKRLILSSVSTVANLRVLSVLCVSASHSNDIAHLAARPNS